MTEVPGWLRPLVEALATGEGETRPPVPAGVHARSSAVLVLFGGERTGGASDRDLLLIERAHTMRRHAGQMAFPGGALDPADAGPEAAALREAAEETGLDPSAVAVLGSLPSVFLPQRTRSPDLPPEAVPSSGFVVVPVLGWWRTPCEVRVADPAEVASVHRVPLDHLTDPANRLLVRHPSGYVGPAFRYGELLVWGFTGRLIDRVLRLGGWERPWKRDPAEDLPGHLLRLSS